VNLSHKLRRLVGGALSLGLVAALVGACGSSGNGGAAPTSTSQTVSGLKQSGVGLTEPTKPSGARLRGGTVYFAEAPEAPPNNIFPMFSPEYCSAANVFELQDMAYRPLYWYGNNYRPTVDYDYSIGKQPVFTNSGKTVTIHLNHYMWSNGTPVTARDLVFWMNVMDADPAAEWCSYVPGKFPQNVTSYKAVNSSTFELTFNRAYNPTWLLYNELSQLTPMPIAWDRTSLNGPTPTASSTNLPDTTRTGARAVYTFLQKQGGKLSSWGSSPLWRIVDGPWVVESTTSNGGVTLVPNQHYSGYPKPSISKFEEIPFISDVSTYNDIKSAGPSGLTVATLPAQYSKLSSSLRSQGYDVNRASGYAFNFFPLNLNNPKVGPIFRQLYFRQAFQHLVDQSGWTSAFLHNAAVNTYSPVPNAPPSPLLSNVNPSSNPYPFSVSDAKTMLTQNGWKVVPGGSSYCVKPGTASGDCGTGITKGEKISFNIDFEAGVTAVQNEMVDLQSQASKAGIKISLTQHPFADVYSAAVHCTSSQPDCDWTAEYWGSGWIYGPQWFPTGENLFLSGSVENYSNYSSPKMDQLINNTLTGPQSGEHANMKKWISYLGQQLPFVFVPTQIGTFAGGAGTLISNKLGGYTASAFGLLTPEKWYLTK
jgi:peptide/nickel transport system substrate-binding protein